MSLTVKPAVALTLNFFLSKGDGVVTFSYTAKIYKQSTTKALTIYFFQGYNLCQGAANDSIEHTGTLSQIHSG